MTIKKIDGIAESYNALAEHVMKETGAESLFQIILNGEHGTGVSVISRTYMQRRVLSDVLAFSYKQLVEKCDAEQAEAEAFAALHVEAYVAKYGESLREYIQRGLEFVVLVRLASPDFNLDTYIEEVVQKVAEGGLTIVEAAPVPLQE